MFRELMSARTAAGWLLAGFGLLAVFHVLVAAGVLPSDIVWGGRADGTSGEAVVLESVALLVTAAFAGLVVLKLRSLAGGGPRRLAGVGAWLVFAYLVLNVVGNLVAGGPEGAIFGPFSAVMAVLALRLALERGASGGAPASAPAREPSLARRAEGED